MDLNIPNHDLHIPDEYVAALFLIEKQPHYEIPYNIQVMVLRDRYSLEEVMGKTNIAAHSFTYRYPDSQGVGALILFSRGNIELSVAAHEATHVALFYHANQIKRVKARALRWLRDHPESLADMTGNLTALIWEDLKHYRK